MHAAHSSHPERRQGAFTVTELVVGAGCLALLALTVLPVMAGGWEKASRFQCANNLRQLHTASMLYANDYNDWFPIWNHPGSAEINRMHGAWYARYVWAGEPAVSVPQSLDQPRGEFLNAGFLYGAGLIGNGQALYCPSLEGTSLGALVGAERYEPLLTSDVGGTVRSSYSYNPRVRDPNITDLRLFQKTSDLVPHKLFIVDHIPSEVAWVNHGAERGWNVLFTDGDVQFSTSEQAYALVSRGLPRNYDNRMLERIFDFLEEEQ